MPVANLWGLLLMVLLTGAAGWARAEAPPVQPVLRVETGMHTSRIMSIAADAQGRWIVTTADDMTGRVWDARTGAPLRVLRPPVDFTGGGQPVGMSFGAISPDGSLIAIGGMSGWEHSTETSVFLFDRASGQLVRRLVAQLDPNAQWFSDIRSLQFSPNGQVLAVGLAHNGFRLYAVKDGRLLQSDTTCSLVSSISFRPDGKQIVVDCRGAHKSLLLKYDSRDGQTFVQGSSANLDVEIITAMYSPSGRTIAVAAQHGVAAIDAATLHLDWAKPVRADEPKIAWTDDSILHVGDIPLNGGDHSQIQKFSESGTEYQAIPISRYSIMSIGALPSGALAFGTTEPAWGIIDGASGGVRLSVDAKVRNFLAPEDTIALSADGSTVGIALGSAREAVFSTKALSLVSPGSARLNPPVTRTPGLDIRYDEASQSALLNGVRLEIPKYSFNPPRPDCLAVSPAGDRFVYCTRDNILYFDKRGTELWHTPAAGGSAVKANISADGKWVVVGDSDGVVRWLRASDGSEELDLFVSPSDRRWALWTPSGYYDAAPGSDDLIGWQVNRTADSAADFYPISRFADVMRRPDVVGQVVRTLDEGQAATAANVTSGRRDPLITAETVKTLLPPTLDLISAPTRFDTDSVTIRYRVREPQGAPMIGEPSVKVNGEWQSRSREVGRVDNGERTLTVTGLPPKDSVIELYATNHNATSTALVVPLAWDGRAGLGSPTQGEATGRKPRLFVLAVGVSQYRRSDLALTFADHDAQQFASAMQAQKGKAYGEVTSQVLVNAAASRAGVEAGLHWLETQVSGDDVGIVFLAGHGFQTTDGDYFFAPADFDPAQPRNTGVRYTVIRDALAHFAKAGNKTVFLVDTCHAGGAVGPALGTSNGESLASELGRPDTAVVVLTAAETNQLSYEDARWGDGAFTKAILEAIVDAKADPEESGVITMLDLGRYVSKRVPVLTEKKQDPLLMMPAGGVPDFPVAAR